MTHDQDLVERLRDVGMHSKCFWLAFSGETERPAEKSRFRVKKGPGRRKGRKLKHQRNRAVRIGERTKLGSSFGYGGPSPAANSAYFCARGSGVRDRWSWARRCQAGGKERVLRDRKNASCAGEP